MIGLPVSCERLAPATPRRRGRGRSPRTTPARRRGRGLLPPAARHLLWAVLPVQGRLFPGVPPGLAGPPLVSGAGGAAARSRGRRGPGPAARGLGPRTCWEE